MELTCLQLQRALHKEPVASIDNMESRTPIPRWILATVTLLTWCVGMAVALTPDGLALLEFKNGLTVISPQLANWSVSAMSPCSWGGITCTHTGRVRNISLSAQVPMLKGNISSSLGKLNLLEGLILDHNMLSGGIPPELGSLNSLRMLVLSNNSLTGPIPPQLGNCSSLVKLWIDTNMLSGNIPESLGNLKNLGSLNLVSNFLTGELSLGLQLSFAAMTNLSYFAIGSNLLSGSQPPMIYKNLSTLEYYDVSNNFFSGDITSALDDLSKLPSIGLISMEGNIFSGTLPPSIGNATTLYYFTIGISKPPRKINMGPGLGGQIPKEIGKLVNLPTLQLGSNSFSGDIPLEFWNMTSITYLDIGQTNRKGQIPSQVANMRLLNVLLLRDNQFNGTIPSSLGNLVNLTWLDLTNNSITGPIPSSFTLLINLKLFALGSNNLTGSIPINMSKTATSLDRALFLNNRMSGPIPHDFGRFMPNLSEFSITNNSFNGTLPDGLCQGGRLEWLTVGKNNLQGAIPPALANCKSLIHVGFADNQFTSIPDGFGSNSTLQYLDASRNQLSKQLPRRFGVNSKLSYLDLSENRLTGDISILEFVHLSQNLSVLKLARNNFSGEIPAAMAICQLLFWVDLSYNSLSGNVPLALANLSSLQELHLQGNNLIALQPKIYLGFLMTLRILNLAENPWNAPIAIEIGSLSILQILNLSYGGYVGPIPSTLGQLAQLEVLDLSHNNLTGKVPIELKMMTSLISVNVSFNRLTGSLPPSWIKFLLADPTSFQGNPGLCLHYDANNICVTKPLKASAEIKLKITKWMIVGVVLGAALTLAMVVGLVVSIALCFQKYKLVQKEIPIEEPTIKIDDSEEISNLTSEPWMFTYEEIMKATEDLSDKYVIGRGGHGTVYKVDCASGLRPSIVVKKVSFKDKKTQIPLHKSFWSEVKTVGKARHRNLVKLLGFIKRDEVGLLLYDYVSNGDLHSALHNPKLGLQVHLHWKARLHIARGVAHGLAYLHHDYDAPIIHRDIKSSNVLLDDDLEAHISDFGLAKMLGLQCLESKPWLSTQNVLGTLGYIAPEAAFGVMAMPQVDVYSFGVLLLELLTGKQAANDPSYGPMDSHIVAWVKRVIELNGGKMCISVLDPALLHPKSLNAIGEMLFVLEIALLFTDENPAERPTMRVIENMLETLSYPIEMTKGNQKGDQKGDQMEDQKMDIKVDYKEDNVESKSTYGYKEGCNEFGHDDGCDRSILDFWNMNLSSEGSKEYESFWSNERV